MKVRRRGEEEGGGGKEVKRKAEGKKFENHMRGKKMRENRKKGRRR